MRVNPLTKNLSYLTSLLRSFQDRHFRLLWLSTLSSAAGMWLQQVAVGWLVLEMTDSPFALGLVSAARMASFLLLGMPAGAVADRYDRRKLLMAISGLSAAYSIAMALLAVTGVGQLWQIIVLTFLFGCARAFESPARQALVYDLVGPQEALRGISLNAVATRLMGVFGGLLGGALIPIFGVQGSFGLMALTYVASGLSLTSMKPVVTFSRLNPVPFWGGLATGLRLLRGNAVVLALVLMSVVAEVFAFSHGTLLPVFARDVLMVGPVGLGVLTASLAVGGIIVSLALAALTSYKKPGQLLLWAFALYGCFLVLYSLSRSYLLSVLLLMGVGAAAAAFDTLQQTILQLSVADGERGRVMGYWVASLGFGPFGHLELGALAGLLGAPLALLINGSVIVAIYLAMVLSGRSRVLKIGYAVS